MWYRAARRSEVGIGRLCAKDPPKLWEGPLSGGPCILARLLGDEQCRLSTTITSIGWVAAAVIPFGKGQASAHNQQHREI